MKRASRTVWRAAGQDNTRRPTSTDPPAPGASARARRARGAQHARPAQIRGLRGNRASGVPVAHTSRVASAPAIRPVDLAMARAVNSSVPPALRRLREVGKALVLQVDPELAADVPSQEHSRAVEASRAPVRVLSPGEWQFRPMPGSRSLGALILVGVVVLKMEFGGCSHLEVLGKGDVLNPWQLETDTRLQEQVSVQVVQSGCVAVLDRRFAEQMTPWPEVFAALMRRQIMRTRRMVLQACILSRSRVDERLELMLWRLGEQFGSMTREGCLCGCRSRMCNWPR